MKLFKRTIRKIAPLAAGVLMLGASAGLGAAADLSEFPQPFVDASGVSDVAIIIGDDAATIDTIAAGSIQSGLVVPLGAGTVTTVSGGDSKEIPMNYSLNDGNQAWGTPLDDSEIATLQDTEIDIQIGDVSDDYSIHEEIQFTGSVSIETGLTAQSPDEDFKDRVFLEISAKDAVKYVYKFDSTLVTGNFISNATTDEPIILNILGKTLEISSAKATQLTAVVGDKFTLAEGETREVEGFDLTLVTVGSDGSIRVDVGGATKIVKSGITLRVGGIRVKNDATIYTTAEGGINQATIVAGEDTVKTYKNNDKYIGASSSDTCDTEVDETSAPECWVWELGGLNTATPTINVSYDGLRDEHDEVQYIGEAFSLPGGFVTITLTSLTEGKWQDYEVSKDSESLYNSTGGTGGEIGVRVKETPASNVLKFHSSGGTNDGFKLTAGIGDCTNAETDTIYAYVNNSYGAIYFDDPDLSSGERNPKFCMNFTDGNKNIDVQFDDSVIKMTFPKYSPGNNVTATGAWNFVLLATDQPVNMTTNITTENIGFGTKDGDSIASNIRVFNTPSGIKNIGAWDWSTLTEDGIKIYDPDNNGDSNRFKFGIPADETNDFEVIVVAAGADSTVITEGSTFSKTPDAMWRDSQITSVQDMNIISVGGSAINRVSAAILDLPYPTFGTDPAWQTATGVTGEGQAIIKLFDSPYIDGKVAMLVAGWTGLDTQRAGKVLNTKRPTISGQEALLNTVTETATVL